MNVRTAVTTAVLVVAAAAASTVTAPTAGAEVLPLPAGCWKPSFTNSIYLVGTGADGEVTSARHVGASEFATVCAGGFSPLENNASGTYIAFRKYVWSPTIYGVVTWNALGTVRPYIETGDALTYAQFVQAGSPSAVTNTVVPGTEFRKYSTGQQVYAATPDGALRLLSYAEYESVYLPPVTPAGAVDRYSFDSRVYLYPPTGGAPRVLSYADWTALQSPPPATPGRLAGDLVFRFADGPAIYLRTPDNTVLHLTPGQWAALGNPTPVVVTH